MPLTGPVSEPGKNALYGIKLAQEEYNKLNKPKINLIIEDSKSQPKDGISAINKLIFQDKVKVVIGDIMSSVFLACAPIAQQNKVVMISPGASNPSVREEGDYIFRIYLSDDYDGRIMANYIIKVLEKRKVAIATVSNDYGLGVEKVFIENFTTLGGHISLQERFPQDNINFRNTILKIKNANPEIIYFVGNPKENGYFVKQSRELNLNIPITGNLSFENNEFINIAISAFDSIIFSAPYFDINSEKEHVESFVKSFNEAYKRNPDIAAGLGYDVLNILLFALKKSEFDISSLKDDLLLIRNFVGVTGKTSFDNKGDVIKDVYIKTVYGDGVIKTLELYSF